MVKAIITSSGGTLTATARPQPTGDLRSGSGVQHLREVALEKGMLAAFEERTRTMTFWTPRILENPEIFNRFRTMYEKTAVSAFAALPEQITDQRRQELLDNVKKNVVPVFSIVGAEDTGPSETLESFEKICPRWHGVILPESGHYSTIENPDDFNQAVLNFLAGVKLYG
jgi:pimeloyl-ACP methyl ester carboxylesterase